MDVVIDNKIYKQASVYAQQQGVSLTSIIEKFLMHFIMNN